MGVNAARRRSPISTANPAGYQYPQWHGLTPRFVSNTHSQPLVSNNDSPDPSGLAMNTMKGLALGSRLYTEDLDNSWRVTHDSHTCRDKFQMIRYSSSILNLWNNGFEHNPLTFCSIFLVRLNCKQDQLMINLMCTGVQINIDKLYYSIKQLWYDRSI